jgi:alpha/beta superfamily hydrolase
VREVIEEVASDELDRGIQIERFNMRGVYSKDPYDGGGAERALAEQARQWADVVTAWPRTSEMLSRVAKHWEHHAQREDIEAQQRLLEG